MAEYLTPDVYVEEVPSGEQTVPGVSQSNAAFVGYTPRGKTNEAVLITSWAQYVRDLGGFTDQSDIAQHVFAFFQNGGRRAYFVRQVGAGAVKASGFMQNLVEEEVVGTGDGATVAFNGTLDNFPVRQVAAGGSILITYDIDGVAVPAEASDMSPTPDGVETSFAGKLGAPSADTPIVPGSVTITDAQVAGPYTYSDTASDGILYDAGADARGFVDYDTGHFTLTPDALEIPLLPGDVTYAYTPRTAGPGVTDDGAGNLTEIGVGTVGTINYTTGVWEIPALTPLGTAPSLQEPLLATYTQDNVAFELEWAGTGGNNVRITVEGDPDYYTRSTGVYTRAIVRIYEKDADGVYQLQETYSAVSFSDASDPKYLLTIVNKDNEADDGSDLVTLSTPTDLEIPQSLLCLSRSRSVSGGNGVATQFGSSGATPTIANPFVTDPLEFPVQPSSVSITYVDTAGAAKTITDDGNGNLIGDVNAAAAAGYNVIDYTTGEFAFEVTDVPGDYSVAAVAAAPMLTATWRKTPTSTSVQDDATGGTNGTLPLTRTELTDAATLKADREGVFAFLKSNETFNVVIPESAGDTDMLDDLTTEANLNKMWFILAATANNLTPLQAQQWRRFTWGYQGNRAALYYPWIMINDPVSGIPKAIPPLGHIAGVYANTVALKNVGWAPSGIQRASLQWLRGLQRKLDDSEIAILDPYQVNCLRHTAEVNKVVWGANTTEQPPADFKYIHSRLLVDFISVSLFRGAHPFVFESTGPDLWARVRTYAERFLGEKFRQDFFDGETPRQAYFVTCDESNNPDPDSEYVYCDVGVRSKRVAKFLVFRISLKVPSA